MIGVQKHCALQQSTLADAAGLDHRAVGKMLFDGFKAGLAGVSLGADSRHYRQSRLVTLSGSRARLEIPSVDPVRPLPIKATAKCLSGTLAMYQAFLFYPNSS